MGFRAAKTALLEAMRAGRIDHEAREAQDEKNWLATGVLFVSEAIAIVEATQGPGECRPHHMLSRSIEVWIFKPVAAGRRWYVKFYLVDEDAIFISFHEAEGGYRS